MFEDGDKTKCFTWEEAGEGDEAEEEEEERFWRLSVASEQ